MAVIARANTQPESDSYMKLVRRFPLKPLKNDREHGEAVRPIEEMLGHPLDHGSSDYLDTLILLANKYEDEHHSPDDAAGTAARDQEISTGAPRHISSKTLTRPILTLIAPEARLSRPASGAAKQDGACPMDWSCKGDS